MNIGQILKPQGIRGEIKVKALTDDPSRFSALKSVYIGQKSYRVTSVRYSGGDVYLKLFGVDDRNGAEALRDKFLSVDRAAAVPLGDGEFFIADLLGATLMKRDGESVEPVGEIKDIRSFGAADVFTVSLDKGEMSFAFVKELDPVFDGEARTFTVDGKKLSEVAVYDD